MEIAGERRETLPATLPQCFESARPSETIAILARLLDTFPERDAAADAQANRLRGYLVACEGVPRFALEEAERRILRAEAEGLNPAFMPKPPELAKLCRRIAAERLWEMTRRPAPSFAEKVARFAAEPDTAVMAKLALLLSELAKAADIERHETRAEWFSRMGDRVKRLEPAS